MKKLLALLLLPLVGTAQTPAAWGGGLGVGNVLEAHVGYQRQGWVVLGRGQYHRWGTSEGPGSSLLDDTNTRSQQLEIAALGGYSVAVGWLQLYSGAGLSYVRGRELGQARYAVAKSNVLNSFVYQYSYRDYQALGLPVEVGILSWPLGNITRIGMAFQADFNPERTIYAGVLTCWLGTFGRATRRAH